MTPKSLAAVHEAAHVITALALKYPVEKVEIMRHEECGEPDCWVGETAYSSGAGIAMPSTSGDLVRYMILSLIGTAAEVRAGLDLPPGMAGSPSDEHEADKAGFILAFVENPHLGRAAREAAPLRASEALDVEGVWRAVLAVAGALEAAHDAGATLLTADVERLAGEHARAVERLAEELLEVSEPPLLGR